MITRNYDYDFLRFIGIAGIVLAHVGSSGLVFQLRNFDVPLLVILSGLAYSQYSVRHYSNYITYVKDRFIRLIIPTWIFLTFFNLFFEMMGLRDMDTRTLLLSYLLVDDPEIGIWVIRVFFLMALIAPGLYWINQKLKNDREFYFLLIFCYVCFIGIRYIGKHIFDSNIYFIFELLILYTLSFGLIYLYGIRLSSFSKDTIKKHIWIASLIFIAYLLFYFLFYDKVFPTQLFKYPPQGYYLAYAMTISLFLFYMVKYTKFFNGIKKNTFLLFSGSSTLWIYLWHWVALKLFHYYEIELGWFLLFFCVFSLALLFAYIQKQAIEYIITQMNLSLDTQKNLRKIFIG